MEGSFSNWRPLTNSASERSMLDSLLFVVNINKFYENVQGTISKFANNTKVGVVVDSEDGYLYYSRIPIKWAEE